MENKRQLEEQLEQLHVEENQLREMLSLIRREINKYQVEQMQLVSQQQLDSLQSQPIIEEVTDSESCVNQRPLDLGGLVTRGQAAEEEEDESD